MGLNHGLDLHHRIRRRRTTRVCVLLSVGLLFLGGCGGNNETEVPTDAPILDDVTVAVGLDFFHLNGMTGDYFFCEMMGPGGGMFDADNDGDLDLYLVQGGDLEGDGRSNQGGDRLWRNDLAPGPDGSLDLRFTDITIQSGLAAHGYGMGVATGDFDNDGWTDLYVTNLGSNQLWRNEGLDEGGTVSFRDVTAQAGVDDERWSTSAVFFDYDQDGWLDLYVANYVDFRLANNKVCSAPNSRRDYCGPKSYEPEPDRLFRNRGDGTFEDVSGSAGIIGEAGNGMGVVASDFDGDALIDLYVANDQTRNLLWINQGDGVFVNRALLAGCAANMDGRAESSMGVDAGDFDNDGDDDLFMTHMVTESHTLFLNDGKGWFRDATIETKVGPTSKGPTGFGVIFFDLENDGWLDLASVNGAVLVIEEQLLAGEPYPLREPNQLYSNTGTSPEGVVNFVDISDRVGAPLAVAEVSRGLASGDIDNDGDADLLVINNNGPAQLLLNRVGQTAPWLGLRLVDRHQGRDMLGARVTLHRPGIANITRRVRTDGSYCSANDPRIRFGLGEGAQLDSVSVRWPDGSAERWPPPPMNAYTTLVQGSGQPIEEE